MIAYDCEIVKAIPPRYGRREEGIDYCAGWRDFSNMGISCIGAYDWDEARARVFCEDNFDEFQALVDKHDIIVSFNGVGFDDQLCAAHGIKVASTYDVLRELWVSAGLAPTFQGRQHGGFSLDATAQANGIGSKTGHGAFAPVLWQQGKIGQVIDYCLQDVKLTVGLVELCRTNGELIHPKDPMGTLLMPQPNERMAPYEIAS